MKHGRRIRASAVLHANLAWPKAARRSLKRRVRATRCGGAWRCLWSRPQRSAHAVAGTMAVATNLALGAVGRWLQKREKPSKDGFSFSMARRDYSAASASGASSASASFWPSAPASGASSPSTASPSAASSPSTSPPWSPSRSI